MRARGRDQHGAPGRALSGVERVHAIIGGFHLSGPLFEPVIAPTVAALREIAPEMIVPAHCTGWRATHLIAADFPAPLYRTASARALCCKKR